MQRDQQKGLQPWCLFVKAALITSTCANTAYVGNGVLIYLLLHSVEGKFPQNVCYEDKEQSGRCMC